MLYAWLVYRTGSVWPAIFAHAIGNASGVIVEWFGVHTGLIARDAVPLDHVPLPILAGALVAVVVGWAIINRWLSLPKRS